MKPTAHVALAALALLVVAQVFPTQLFAAPGRRAAGHAARATKAQPEARRAGGQVAVRAAGRGAPRVNLDDARAVDAAYSSIEAARRLDDARSRALASADFDEDGTPDLVAAYAVPGGGAVALHRGNVDAVYPNAPEAKARKAAGEFTGAPFLPEVKVFDTPEAADFAGAGDFDADGHFDVVVAARSGDALYLLAGDGRGAFAAPERVALPGRVTALAVGEMNRADGLADVAVGVDAGPAVLVFQGSRGALRGEPRATKLPAPARSLTLGAVDDDHRFDLLVAAGDEVIAVFGHDGGSPAVSRRRMPADVASAAFMGADRNSLAVLLADGRVETLVAPETGRETLRAWSQGGRVAGAWGEGARLVPARVASGSAGDLLVLDRAGSGIHVVPAAGDGARAAKPVEPIALDVEGAPEAVLPMRLSPYGLDSLVVLSSTSVQPAVAVARPLATFTVTDTGDTGSGTLRDAILGANSMPGPDLIDFAIPGGGTAITIFLLSELPALTDTVMIDGTTQAGFSGTPIVELDGSNAGSSTGLLVQASSCVVRGLVIKAFQIAGIDLNNAAVGSSVEGNYIGVNATGATAAGNSVGMTMFGTSSCTVGGTAPPARNVISGNLSMGISFNSIATGNIVSGNNIGVDASGMNAVGNGNAGIFALAPSPMSLTIGGASPGGGNLISGNLTAGVRIGDGKTAGSALVQGNRIGVDATTFGSIPNMSQGVFIESGDGSTIGGTTPETRNIIASNGSDGIACELGSGNAFLGNNIFDNGGLGIALDVSGVTPNDPFDGDAGPNDLQNFPVLTSAIVSGGMTTITGTLNSKPGSPFLVEFFRNPDCDGSGNGEGKDILGSTMVMTNPSGDAVVGATFPGGMVGEAITATATDSNNNTSEFSACVTVMTGTADLSVTRDAAPDPVQAGATLTFTVTVTNEGPDDAANVRLADAVPANTTFVSIGAPIGWSCSAPPPGGTGPIVCMRPQLAPSASEVFTIVVRVNSDTPGGTVITGTSTVSTSTDDPEPDNNTAQTDTDVEVSADLSVTKVDSPDPATPGQNVTYTITVRNDGPSDASNVALSDEVPADTTFVSLMAPPGWSCTTPAVGATGDISCTRPGLAAGAVEVFTLVVNVDLNLDDGSQIDNTASVASDTDDPDAENDSATATTDIVLQAADLLVTKEADADRVAAGDQITYTIQVENAGPRDAINARLDEAVPANTTFASLSAPGGWTCTTPAVGAVGPIVCTNPAFASGATAVFTLVVTTSPSAQEGTVIMNTVTVESAVPDPISQDNTAMAQVTIEGTVNEADLGVEIAAEPDPVLAGMPITYSITVTNDGPFAATGVSLDEQIPQDTTFLSLSAPGGWSCQTPAVGATGSVTCTIATLAPGATAEFALEVLVSPTVARNSTVDATATVSSTSNDPEGGNNSASVSTEVDVVESDADLSVSIEADPETATSDGEVNYTITIDNDGPEAATGVTLTTGVPAGASFVEATASQGDVTAPEAGASGMISVSLGVIPAGDQATVTFVVSVDAEPGATLSATATVVGASTDPNTSDNTARATTPVRAPQGMADLSIEIGPSSDPVVTGDRLTYTIDVNNLGPDEAPDTVVTAAVPVGTRFLDATTGQGTVEEPPDGSFGAVTWSLGTIPAGQTVTLTLAVRVTAGNGATVVNTARVASGADDENAFDNVTSSRVRVQAAEVLLLDWDPPNPNAGLNPPPRNLVALDDDPRPAPEPRRQGGTGQLVCYNVYRSNQSPVQPTAGNLFMSVPPNQTMTMAPVGDAGAFFVVTACYTTGESGASNQAAGGIPGPVIASITLTSKQLDAMGTGFTSTVTVLIDGVGFSTPAKVKKNNTRVKQKGRLTNGQTIGQFVRPGQTVMITFRNSDGGETTVPLRRP